MTSACHAGSRGPERSTGWRHLGGVGGYDPRVNAKRATRRSGTAHAEGSSMLLASRARLLSFALLTFSAFAASSVLVVRPAAAQVITETNNQAPLDYLSDYTTPSTHPNNIGAQWISYAD